VGKDKGTKCYSYLFFGPDSPVDSRNYIVACMKTNEKEVARKAGLKKCPACAEYGKPEALVCRFCKSAFPVLQGKIA